MMMKMIRPCFGGVVGKWCTSTVFAPMCGSAINLESLRTFEKAGFAKIPSIHDPPLKTRQLTPFTMPLLKFRMCARSEVWEGHNGPRSVPQLNHGFVAGLKTTGIVKTQNQGMEEKLQDTGMQVPEAEVAVHDCLDFEGKKVGAKTQRNDTATHLPEKASDWKDDQIKAVSELIKKEVLFSHRDIDDILNEPDEAGNTLLMRAVSDMNVELVRLLIEAGANLELRNNNSQTAFDMARDNYRADRASGAALDIYIKLFPHHEKLRGKIFLDLGGESTIRLRLRQQTIRRFPRPSAAHTIGHRNWFLTTSTIRNK